MKHCNRAHVWGIIDKFETKTTEGGKPYLEVYIDCRHDEYGSVRILGFVWGKDTANHFNSSFGRGDEVRFSGGIQQYTGRNGVTRTTFNFYILKPGPVREHKAAFILVGEVVSLEGESLEILIKQDVGANGGSPANDAATREDTFKIHLPREVLLEAEHTPEPGQSVSVKGYIMHHEDEYGEACGPQQPVIKELKFL